MSLSTCLYASSHVSVVSICTEFAVLFVQLCAVDVLMSVYACIHSHVCIFMCLCVQLYHVYTSVYLYLSVCMSVYVCVSICVCVSVWTRGLRMPPVGGIWPGDVFGLAHRVFSAS